MSKLIICEGPDRAGKTTLAKFIARKLGGIYIHASGHQSLQTGMQAYHESLMRIAQWALDQDISVVMDRLWPSEIVYGSILRPNHPGHLAYDCPKIRGACKYAGAIYVFCLPHDAVERHAADRDHDHAYDDKNFSEIVKCYGYVRDSMSEETVVNYDVNEHGSDIAKWMQEVGI